MGKSKRHRAIWIWNTKKPIEKTKSNINYIRVKQKIKKAIETHQGISAKTITNILNCVPYFIGCYSDDQLNISVQNFPSFLIVNLDKSYMPGSHWIAIGIFKSTVEIFDSLGFNVFKWSRIPCGLLNFLHRLTISRRAKLCQTLQNSESVLCGFYSIFYIYARQYVSFKCIQNLFSKKLSLNDDYLQKLF